MTTLIKQKAKHIINNNMYLADVFKQGECTPREKNQIIGKVSRVIDTKIQEWKTAGCDNGDPVIQNLIPFMEVNQFMSEHSPLYYKKFGICKSQWQAIQKNRTARVNRLQLKAKQLLLHGNTLIDGKKLILINSFEEKMKKYGLTPKDIYPDNDEYQEELIFLMSDDCKKSLKGEAILS